MKAWSTNKSDVPLFAIVTAHKCAWRAFYVYVRVQTAGSNEWYERQVFHLGIDPTASRPSIFGAVQWHRRGFSWRVPVKLLSWRMVMRFPFLRRLYVWQGYILFKLDGRF